MPLASRRRLVVLLLAVAVVAAAAFALPIDDWTERLLEWTAGRGAWTGVIMALVWVPAAVLFVPGALLTLGAGFLLGVLWGSVTVSIGSTAGAAAAFLVGRTLARRRVERMVRGRPRFQAVDEAVGRAGLRIVLLTRLSPLFPYNFLNYAYSVTGVSFRDFALGSWIGMLPGTVLYTYIGSGARTLAGVAAGGDERSTAEILLFGAGLAATVLVTVLLTRLARQALAGRVGEET